jgi:hypothetical protein
MSLLTNMYVYQESVPEPIKFIYDLETNPNYLKELDENIYNIIRRLPDECVDKINNYINPSNSQCDDDIFLTFKTNRDTDSIDIITQSKYVKEESTPFQFNLFDDGIVCDFLDPDTFENKLSSSSTRYISFDAVFASDLKESAHSVLIIFDTKTRSCYFLDSNSDLCYLDYPELDIYNSELVHKSMEFYSGLLLYNYVRFNDLDIEFRTNFRINSQFQKSFFKGYCRGWTLFFQYLLLVSSESFEFINFMKTFQETDILILNQLVEIFQVWYYHLVLDISRLDNGIQTPSLSNCD